MGEFGQIIEFKPRSRGVLHERRLIAPVIPIDIISRDIPEIEVDEAGNMRYVFPDTSNDTL